VSGVVEWDDEVKPHEGLRQAVDKALQAYTADCYEGGHSATYVQGQTLVLCIVNSKYNPANFWYIHLV
jgi:hypothetical protein